MSVRQRVPTAVVARSESYKVQSSSSLKSTRVTPLAVGDACGGASDAWPHSELESSGAVVATRKYIQYRAGIGEFSSEAQETLRAGRCQ